MKAFIRTLNLKERKGFNYTLCYGLFLFLQSFFLKILITQYQLSSYTVICLQGSIFSLICLFRILIVIKKNSKKSKIFDSKLILSLSEFYEFISFICLLLSLYFLNLTNLILIIRLFPFLLIFIEYGYVMSNSEIICFLTYITVFLIIFLPSIGSFQIIGMIFGLFSVIGKILSFKYWRNAIGLTIEIMLLGVGLFSISFGGNLMIRFGKKQMEKITIKSWILIILSSFCTYYKKIFFLKIMKNPKNIDKIILVNSITILITIPIDLFMFNQNFGFRYLILFLLFGNSIFFGINVCKRSQLDINLNI
jgi:hypothetical protein